MPSFNISDEDRELIIKAVEAARNQPKLVDGIWWIWDFDKRRYVNTGEIGAVQAQTLGSLNNVTDEADQLDPDDQILIKKAGKSTWTLLNPDFASRADVETLKQIVSSLSNGTSAILQVLKYDEARDAWYIDGNFYANGQNAAGGIGEEEGGSGVGGGIIDEEMSDTSSNAVANKVIKEYVDKTDAVLSERIAVLELGEGDKYYYHTQAATAEEWEIEHNLGKYPSVTVVSSAGEEIYCDKTFVSINKVVLNFGTPISGAAFLN